MPLHFCRQRNKSLLSEGRGEVPGVEERDGCGVGWKVGGVIIHVEG